MTHHFSLGGQEGYVTVGLYEDGLPGELFIRMAKEGSTVSGLMDSFATPFHCRCSMASRHNAELIITAVMRRNKLSEGSQKKLRVITLNCHSASH